MSSPRVVVDLVAPQSPSYRGRGIARHGLAFAEALVRRHPDAVERVLVHPELPPAEGMATLAATGKLATSLDPAASGGIFHVTSPFEPELAVRTLWPRAASARGMALAVTVYDLIPDIFPEMYLQDPGLRRRWRCGRELVRAADHVFAISSSARDDVVSMLGVPASRVTVIGSGVDARFAPGDRGAALRRARAAVPGLGDRFLVCNGAVDPRKNMPRLVEALARLDPAEVGDLQLVLACRMDPLERNHFAVMADRLGVGDRVLLPGFVADATLVDLYRSCSLAVFPSLYEGYGLPVIEARACGALVVAGDNSSLREITPPMARFEATDVEAMAAVIGRAVSDPAWRRALAAVSDGPLPTWDEVADATMEGYTQLTERMERSAPFAFRWRSRRSAALVAQGTGAGEVALAGEVAGDYLLDVFTTSPERSAGVLPLGALPSMDRWRGGYDLVLVAGGEDDRLDVATFLPDGDVRRAAAAEVADRQGLLASLGG